MAWSSETTGNSTDVNSTEQFTSGILITPGGLHDWYVDFNPPSTPTDAMQVSVYGSKGTTSSPDWDDVARLSLKIDNDTDPNQASFNVSGIRHYRVGFKMDGATDTGDVDFSHFDDGVSL